MWKINGRVNSVFTKYNFKSYCLVNRWPIRSVERIRIPTLRQILSSGSNHHNIHGPDRDGEGSDRIKIVSVSGCDILSHSLRPLSAPEQSALFDHPNRIAEQGNRNFARYVRTSPSLSYRVPSHKYFQTIFKFLILIPNHVKNKRSC